MTIFLLIDIVALFMKVEQVYGKKILMVNKYQSDLPRNLCIHVQSVNPYVNADGRSPFDFRSSLSIDLYSLFFLSFFPVISSKVVYLIHQMYFCVEFRPSCACHLRAPLSFILGTFLYSLGPQTIFNLWFTLSVVYTFILCYG